jgi:N-acetyl-anhydromuramyl-L-alanine amidase AmpD
LSQLVLARDGTYHVVAAGKSNHAGPGKWQGVTAGNSQMIGIEAENTGLLNDQPWPKKQMDAYIRGVAAILKQIGADSVMVCGHKEYALPAGRKPDPTFDMVAFRKAVEDVMGGNAIAAMPAAVDPARSMLKKGDMGPSVRKLQKLLGITDDGNFGPKTEAKVKSFQRSKGLVDDGLVGQKTWAALGITNSR